MKGLSSEESAGKSPKGIRANRLKKIRVTEEKGIFRVNADFRNGFHLVPSPSGRLNLAFWDEARMKVFLGSFGFDPEIIHTNL